MIGINKTRTQEKLLTSSGAYSIGPFTFKLKILNLTLHFCRTFSLFSGCSTNLKTGKLERRNVKNQNRTLGSLAVIQLQIQSYNSNTSCYNSLPRGKDSSRRAHEATLWCSCLKLVIQISVNTQGKKSLPTKLVSTLLIHNILC